MNRVAYQRSVFLDRRVQPVSPTFYDLPVPTVAREVEALTAQQCRWIFHMARCGSTLLANLLDHPGDSLVLREPPALRQMGLEKAHEDRGDFRDRVTLARTLSARRFSAEEAVVIKANVPVNFIVEDLQNIAANEPAIALYLDWQDYLVAILRSNGHREWVVRITDQLRPLIVARLGKELPGDTPERAAALWLVQMSTFHELLAENPNSIALNANDLFQAPISIATISAAHLGLEKYDAKLREDQIGKYSKDPNRSFSSTDRQIRAEQDQASLSHELKQAEQWLAGAQNIMPVSSRFIRSLS